MSREKAPPLVPAEVDVSALPYMPIYIARLTGSKAWLICKRKPELTRPLLCLWMRAWQERPAGSIEADDDVLANAAQLEFDKFQDLRDDLLRGWKLCSDGRYYHPAIADFVMTAWETVLKNKKRTAAATKARLHRSGQRDDDVTSDNAQRHDHQGRKEGRKEGKKGGSTSLQNGAKHPRIAFLEARGDLTAGRAIVDAAAFAVATELGVDSTRALDDKREAFEARYLQRTSTPAEH